MSRCSVEPRQYVYVGFCRRKIPRSMAYTIAEKAIRFRHPHYNPDLAQKLISSSMCRHLSTRNISSKYMHAFLSNLANRQTDKRGQTHLHPPLSEVITVTWDCENGLRSRSYTDRQSYYRHETPARVSPKHKAKNLPKQNWSLIFHENDILLIYVSNQMRNSFV